MKYHDKHAVTEWNCVFIPFYTNDNNSAVQWCMEHESHGRYCYECPRGNNEHGLNWFFEKEKDAVIFALKFV